MTPNFCINCGEALKPGAHFCSNCGAPIEENPISAAAAVASAVAAPQQAAAGASSVAAADTDFSDVPVEDVLIDGAMPEEATAPIMDVPFISPRPRSLNIPTISPSAAAFARPDMEHVVADAPAPQNAEGALASQATQMLNWSTDVSADETRVLHFNTPLTDNEPVATESADKDLSGFDVPATPFFDDDNYLIPGNGYGPKVADAASSAQGFGSATDEWAAERPEGWTAGLNPQRTSVMTTPVTNMNQRGDTDIMSPITDEAREAAGVFGAPQIYSAQNTTSRRWSAGKIALVVAAILCAFAIIYYVQFNPYWFENLQSAIRDWGAEQGQNLLGQIVQQLNQLGK